MKTKRINIIIFSLILLALGLTAFPLSTNFIVKADSYIATERDYGYQEPSQISDIPNRNNTAFLDLGDDVRTDFDKDSLFDTSYASVIFKLDKNVKYLGNYQINIEFSEEVTNPIITNSCHIHNDLDSNCSLCFDAYNVYPKGKSKSFTIKTGGSLLIDSAFWFNFVQLSFIKEIDDYVIKDIELVPIDETEDKINTSVFCFVSATKKTYSGGNTEGKYRSINSTMDIPLFNNFNEISEDCQSYTAKINVNDEYLTDTNIKWLVVDDTIYPKDLDLNSLTNQVESFANNKNYNKSYYTNDLIKYYATKYHKFTGYTFDENFDFKSDFIFKVNYETYECNTYQLHFMSGNEINNGSEIEITSLEVNTFNPTFEDPQDMFDYWQNQIKTVYQHAYDTLVRLYDIENNKIKEFVGWDIPYTENMKLTNDLYIRPIYQFKNITYDVKLYDENGNLVKTIFNVANGTKISDLDLSEICKDKKYYTFQYFLSGNDNEKYFSVNENSIINYYNTCIKPVYKLNDNAIRVNIYAVCVQNEGKVTQSELLAYNYTAVAGDIIQLPLAPYYDSYSPAFWTTASTINQSNYEQVKSDMIGTYGIIKEFVVPQTSAKRLSLTLVYNYEKNSLIIDSDSDVELNEDEKLNQDTSQKNNNKIYIVLGSTGACLTIIITTLFLIRRKKHYD